MSPIDERTFWRTLGQRAIGVTIVTARGSSGPAGFLGLSATHVSADPPTMLVSIDERTTALKAVVETMAFAINYLSAESKSLVDIFSGKSGQRGAERFDGSEWSVLETGAPVHKQAIGAFDCVVTDILPRNSTTLVLGQVVKSMIRAEAAPLIMFRGEALEGIWRGTEHKG